MSESQERVSVVTGGAGFIGSHVADRLLERGDRVVVVDDLSTGRLDRVPAGATFEQLDITDVDALRELAEAVRPDQWFHLAAQADVRVSVEDPMADARVNVLGTIAVVKASEVTGSPVIFSSTGGAIYGEEGTIPAPETEQEMPLSPYGAAKLSAEKYLLMHGRLRGVAHAILRFANVYGPRQDPHGEAGVVAIFGGRLLAGEPVTVYGDGEQTRDYVYVGDVVDAMVSAARLVEDATTPLGPLNVGTGVETSVNHLLATMQAAAGTQVEPVFAPPRLGELSRSALDMTVARRVLGVAFDTPLHDGLQRTLESIGAQRPAVAAR